LDLIAGQTTTRTYNAFSELTSEILPHGHLAEYAYDSLGRRIKASIDGKTADYAYDAVHLRSVSYGPYTHTYDEYDQGRLKQGTLVDNTKYDLSYTLNGQPSSRAFNSCQEDLTYDPNDNLINKTLKDPFGTESFIFEYDELDQLCYEETNVPCKLIHDSLNNRVQKDDSEYQLNDLNQITGIDDDFFTYDPNGNLIASSTAAYTYDALDRLISITQNGQTTRYTYGPFHRRLTSKTQNETHYLYLENNEVGSKSPHKEEFRVLGQGLGAEIGAAVLIELDGQIYAPIHDHTGSVVCLLSPSGRATQAYRYTPFGETIKTESSLKNPWRFSSKRHDPTGLIYFGRRYYDPTLGRWLTCDPRGFDDGPNLYAYVHNNPLTHFDEYGLFDDYWDMTADEAATYDREAYAKGAIQAAGQSYAFAEDILVGGIRDFSLAILSEGLDPSNPLYATPFSQQSFYQQAGLAAFAALDVMQVGKAIKVGKKAYNLANAGLKVYNASKACKTTLKATNSFRLAKAELTAFEKGLNLKWQQRYW